MVPQKGYQGVQHELHFKFHGILVTVLKGTIVFTKQWTQITRLNLVPQILFSSFLTNRFQQSRLIFVSVDHLPLT